MATVECGHPAFCAARWVDGTRLVLCSHHHAHALRVAQALGMSLFVDDLADGETGCTQKVDPSKALNP